MGCVSTLTAWLQGSLSIMNTLSLVSSSGMVLELHVAVSLVHHKHFSIYYTLLAHAPAAPISLLVLPVRCGTITLAIAVTLYCHFLLAVLLCCSSMQFTSPLKVTSHSLVSRGHLGVGEALNFGSSIAP